jgi:hypothetical protein
MSRLNLLKFAPFRNLIAALVLASASIAVAQPSPQAIHAFDSYVSTVESRLAAKHQSPQSHLANFAPSSTQDNRLRSGDILVERLTPASVEIPGAKLHHWRASAFAPGATPAGFERLMKNFAVYPQIFSPQVIAANAVSLDPNHFQATLRVQQRHAITVVMDTTYDVTFLRLDARHIFSTSRSTRIAEIASPNSPSEHPLAPGEEHGFLWRQNTYWTCEERDGGLYLQVESVSLTRNIPTGLGWALRPFVESVPRESLEFTLRSTVTALKSTPHSAAQLASTRPAN